MIVYQLRCGKDHEFEAWFRDSSTYTRQASSGDVACPFCGDTDVRKAVMAPNISTRKDAATVVPEDEDSEKRARQVAEKILQAVSQVRDHVVETCDDVGEEFADEARRIHHGEAEDRGIYGQASDEEAEELDEEGIEIFRLPNLPRRDS